MRRYKQHTRRPDKNNLIIAGAGVLIVMMIAIIIFDYSIKNMHKSHLPYSELKQNYKLIEDDATYEFMNEILHVDSILLDSMEYTKIVCFSIGHSKDLKEFIKDLPDSIIDRSDKRYMINQLYPESLLWDNSKLKNCWILTPHDLNKISTSDVFDYWEEFRRIYGKYGEHSYSKPIFNKNKTVVVLEHIVQGDVLWGSDDIIAFIKKKGKWILLKNQNLWVSQINTVKTDARTNRKLQLCGMICFLEK